MDESKIILVDIDNVLWDLTKPWIQWINEEQNLNMKPEDCKEWDIHKLYPMLTSKEIYSPLEEAKFWDTVIPYEDAKEYIPKLQEKYLLKIVSATTCLTGLIKIPKIIKAFPTIKEEDIILCYNKSYIRGKYQIDDNIAYLNDREVPIIFNSYHNILESSYYNRVNNWSEIYNLVERFNSL